MNNPVRVSTKKVTTLAQYVKINYEEIPGFIRSLPTSKPDFSKLETLGKLNTDEKQQQLTFLILMHRTGFCFWNAETTRWHYTFKDGTQDKGQFAFFQAWVDYFNADPQRFNFEYFADLPFDQFKDIFQGGENLYFLKERWEFVRDISKHFLSDWDGNIEKFILSAEHRLDKLIPLITSKLPNYNDKALYKGENVYFWKLAQLFAYDLIANFKDDAIGQFDDIEYLTGLPDYKFPQLFEANKLMNYKDSLNQKISNKILIPSGSEEEVEIRSATVVLVDLLYEEYKKQGGEMELYEFEHLLFMKAKTTEFEKPYHLAKSLFY
jgi:hypothetical protein